MSRISLIRAAEGRRERWKNDGGWTTEIARDAQSGGPDFLWRVSIAEIERDGPFSRFDGVERDLMLLSGAGIELAIGSAAPRRLDERFQRIHFAGEDRADCRLLGGPTRDFNVMTRRGAYSADVMARPLVDSIVLLPETAATWLAHVVSGHATASCGDDTETAGSADTLRVELDEGAGRVVLDGGAELVLVRLVASRSRE